MTNNNATCNFWRCVENLSVTPTLDQNINIVAVSQATALRRVHVKGNMNLWDGGWSSGGFIADSKIEGQVNSGLQQQWFSRNTEWGSWRGANWNMIFVGVSNPPAGRWPDPPYVGIYQLENSIRVTRPGTIVLGLGYATLQTDNITAVSLLGCDVKLGWKQTADGLVVTLPAKRVSEFTAALRITGTELKNISFAVPTEALAPDAKGNFKLDDDDDELHGDLKTEDHGGQSNIGFWDKSADSASWKVNFPQAGAFKVSASPASTSGASEFVIEAAGQQISGKAEKTTGWDQFKEISLGQLEIKQAGEQVVSIRPKDAANSRAMNLRFVKLTKAE